MTDDFPSPPADAEPDREGTLPDHELDREGYVGGGVLGEGGTAIERGTDTLSGPDAQGPFAGEDGGTSTFPSLVDLDDHAQVRGDDPATPGLDDYTEGRDTDEETR